jgi:hypothetical protein
LAEPVTTTGSTRDRSALMIENLRSGMLWNLMRTVSAITTGLRRAGFRNWLAPGGAPDERHRQKRAAFRAARRRSARRRAARQHPPPDWTNPTPGALLQPRRHRRRHRRAGHRPSAPPASAPRWRWWSATCSAAIASTAGCVPSKALLRSARFYADLRNGGPFIGTAMPPSEADFTAAMERMRASAPTSVTTTRRSASSPRHRRVLG